MTLPPPGAITQTIPMRGCSGFLVLALLVGACGGDATQLVVVVDSDIAIPGELDQVQLRVTGPAMTTQTVMQGLTSAAELPLTVSVVPGETGALGPVRVVAVGSVGGRDIVEASVTTSLRAGRSLMVRLFLRRSCVDVSCPDSETCDDGVCRPDAVDAASLPPWTGTAPGRDAATPDASTDAGTDSGDAGPTDAAPTDAGLGDAGTCRGPADCDDGLDCTLDSCSLDGCIHTPDDSVCTAAAEGTCETTLGCQYASCTSETCTAGPCQMAVCMGDTCMRSSSCSDGQTCCADACVAAGCNDGVDCTADSCGATGCENTPMDALCEDGNECTDGACELTGCDFTNNSGSCEDGMFCNGADTCAAGACGGHEGDPCPGASVCDEAASTCTGCATDSDCPADSVGSYGACGSFSDGCDETGRQSRSTTSFSCSAGSCLRADGSEDRACARTTDSDSCGDPIVGAWDACSGFSGACGESGTQTRSVTTPSCASGSCDMVVSNEMRSCSRSTNDDECGTTSCPSWGACSYTGTCDEAASQTRSCTDRRCSAGSCRDVSRGEAQACNRDTDDDVCGVPSCEAWGECSYSSTCDESGTETRTCQDRVCSSGVCTTSPSRDEDRTCSRSTSGVVCGGGGAFLCRADSTCSGGACVLGSSTCTGGLVCCEGSCSTMACL